MYLAFLPIVHINHAYNLLKSYMMQFEPNTYKKSKPLYVINKENRSQMIVLRFVMLILNVSESYMLVIASIPVLKLVHCHLSLHHWMMLIPDTVSITVSK